jgi:hypothetical protein
MLGIQSASDRLQTRWPELQHFYFRMLERMGVGELIGRKKRGAHVLVVG